MKEYTDTMSEWSCQFGYDGGDVTLSNPDPCPNCGNDSVLNVSMIEGANMVRTSNGDLKPDDWFTPELSHVDCAKCGMVLFDD
jgi:ribosomal protein S27AE